MIHTVLLASLLTLVPATQAATEPPKKSQEAIVLGPLPVVLDYPAGGDRWRGYQVVVPSGTTVTLAVKSAFSSGFRVRLQEQLGHSRRGMQQNLVGHLKPEASFRNAGSKPETVDFIVTWEEKGGTPSHQIEAGLLR